MSPTPRAAALLAGAAAVALLAGPVAGAVAALAVLAAVGADAWTVRGGLAVERTVARIHARGRPSPLRLAVEAGPGRAQVLQPVPPDLELAPVAGSDGRQATLTPRRRGRHALEDVAVRREGPLGLGRWDHRAGGTETVSVYPDVPAARRLAHAVRQGRFRDAGMRSLGPFGLGTEFESIRDYLPDDDIRQVNWAATVRAGQPMSNQYRIEQDREVMLLLDCGRLMTAPLGDVTCLDLTVDAAVAVAAVADVVGDRCGLLAFDGEIRRRLPPRRAAGDAVARALFDLEPRAQDADYGGAFRAVEGGKRALVVVLTDLLEETAARPLLDAVPVLARRHAVVVAGVRDPEVERAAARPPAGSADVYRSAVALEVLRDRRRVAHALRRAGADVVEAPPRGLGRACVGAYLRAKARGRA